ncbi:hypothetical protein HRI_002689300 [Hibiscus trionum]|uniref:Zinc knuckle CX2CX4HX4C domain-containing protein n=1 Tax=Hibiscus trionum TaxID=183268 RepID=A0A9W7M9C0_HIBTR|nr:hypothetical protein HRI_002689300 [Hibiscus trionum]
MDSITVSRQRVAFAKVCVELEAGANIPRLINVKLGDGSLASIVVEVRWLPPSCGHCIVFGHSGKNCTQNVAAKKNRVPKAGPAVTNKQHTMQVGCEGRSLELETGVAGSKDVVLEGKGKVVLASSESRLSILVDVGDGSNVEVVQDKVINALNEESSMEEVVVDACVTPKIFLILKL